MTRCTGMLRRSSFVKSHACALAIIVMLAMGCRREALAPLRVAAASDLQSALPRLNERFQARTGIVASLTFGASGQLSQQIKQGAPFDVFLSADEAIIHALAVGGFVKSGSIHRYTRGSLVLAVNEAFAEQVQSLDDLTKPVVKKIALANPAIAPYGRAGEQALQRAALWDRIEPKIVIAESVRQALLYAQKGDVEAALVGRAIANVPEVRRVAIESELYDPIIQALGVVTATARSAEAEKFAGFITGAEGQGILKEFGFSGIEP